MNGVIAPPDEDFVNERATAGARAKTNKLESDLAVPQDAVMVAVKLNQKRTVQLKVKIRRSVLHQELPDFSIFKPFFLAPLHPDTFASHVVPSWIRPPSVLSSIALAIHPHWHQRRSLRGGRKICPLLNTEEDDHINAAYVCFRNIPIRTRRAQKSKAGKGTAGRPKVESSVQLLANEREKFENVSPRRSQRLKPQRREGQEPLHIMQSYAKKVSVGSGAPGPSRDSGTSHLQLSIKHKVSSARTTTSHVNPGRDSLEGPPNIPRPVAQLEKPTSDTNAPQKAQNLPLTKEGKSTDRTRNVAATSGSGSQRGVPRSLRASTTPKMSQTFIQLGPVRHENTLSTRHDHEGFALPPSLPECLPRKVKIVELTVGQGIEEGFVNSKLPHSFPQRVAMNP
ncbi:hypothetical protein B0H14DRAFT_2625845 [Mycena olivaceomarginata]|nr:hypothetical protein B0H14DRAFT_2625845 [Mycena olivaceomarginata]